MSRFEQDLERDLGQIADRATPSPDAWNSILERIDTQEPITETEIIMLTDNTLTTRRWPLYAAAAAVVGLLIGGLALVNRDDGAEVPANPPTPTVAVEPEPESETAEVDDTPLTLPEQGTQLTLAPGRYEVDTFGVSVSFEVPTATSSPWTVQVNDDIAISLGDDNGFVNMSRVGSFYDADQAQAPERSGLGSIAPDDIDGWIEANGITVEDSRDVTIGGRSAKLRQVSAPVGAGQDSCPPEIQPCVSLSSASADQQSTYSGVSAAAYGAFPHTFWLIELDDFEPLMIWAHTEGPETQGWLDEVTPLIDSIVLGDPAPAVEGGTARLPQPQQFFATYRTPRGPGIELSDGTIVRSSVSTLVGDVAGEITGTGVEVTPANGFDDMVFSGTIDGVGVGTLTMHQEWTGSENGTIATTTVVTRGTEDFAGITGRVFTSVDQPDESRPVPIYTGPMTFELLIPADGSDAAAFEVATEVTVAEAYSGVRADGEPLADGSVPITYAATTDGTMTGEIVGTGTYLVGSDAITSGSDAYVFSGTIEGIGAGNLAYVDEWTATGPTESTIIVTITGGTGDFAGITGTGTTTVDTSDKVGADDTITGTNTFNLVVPRSG